MNLFNAIRFVAVCLSFSLGVYDTNTIPNHTQDVYSLELKVDALTKGFEQLRMESKAKDNNIGDLEKRVIELEKMQTDQSNNHENNSGLGKDHIL